jgi:hypothetical protein
MDGVLRSTLPFVLMSISLLACTSSATDRGSEWTPVPSVEIQGVTLVLVASHGSDRCCRVSTVNPGSADLTVACGLVALNPAGRLIYSAVVPARLPGTCEAVAS